MNTQHSPTSEFVGLKNPQHSPKRMLFLDLVLSVFRLNGLLIAEGDAMTESLGLTSARWKVIGVVALSNAGLTVPGIARVLGQSRQAVKELLTLWSRMVFFIIKRTLSTKNQCWFCFLKRELVLITSFAKCRTLGLSEILKTSPFKN